MMNNIKHGGKLFREAWIAGVKAHYPGEPKPGYISPWEEMPEWEQTAANAVFEKTRSLILVGLQHESVTRLTPEQGGRFVSEAWNVQIFKNVPNPKPSYTADWEDLPEWQQKTDILIFTAIEEAITKTGIETSS